MSDAIDTNHLKPFISSTTADQCDPLVDLLNAPLPFLPALLYALEAARRERDSTLAWHQRRWDRLHVELRKIGDEDLRTRCCAIVANGKATWDERSVYDDLAATKAALAEIEQVVEQTDGRIALAVVREIRARLRP